MIEGIVRAIVYYIAGWLMEWSLNGCLIIIGVAIIGSALISKVKEHHLIDYSTYRKS
jgi:hypothetical protein